MIADSLANLNKYHTMLPYSKEISEYLNKTDIFSLKKGKYEIFGESVFLLIQEYRTVAEADKFWESHRKFIDLQVVLEGQEHMGYSPVSLLSVKDKYNEENDYTLYQNNVQEYTRILVTPKHFCIFYPEDGHKPGIHLSKENEIKKAVIKVRL